MSIEIIAQTPVVIEIVSPTTQSVEVFPHVTFVNELAGTPIFVGDAAGGDLNGTYPDPVVHKLHGHDVANTTPSVGNLLAWRTVSGSTKWRPSTTAEAGVAAVTHKHFLASDLLDVQLDGWEDRYTTVLPLLAFDSNTDEFKLVKGSLAGADVTATLTAAGEVNFSFATKLGTIPRVKARSGKYETNIVTGATTSSTQLSANTLYLTPFMPQFDMSFSTYVCGIGTAGTSSNARICFYDSNPDTGYPIGVPYDFSASFATTATGATEVATGAGTINLFKNVQYWIGLQTDSSSTQASHRVCSAASLVPIYHSLTTNNPSVVIVNSGQTFGTFRNFTTNPVVDADFSTSGQVAPILGVKVS